MLEFFKGFFFRPGDKGTGDFFVQYGMSYFSGNIFCLYQFQ